MIEIKELLARFSNILFKEINKKDFIVESINFATNLNIKSEDINFRRL